MTWNDGSSFVNKLVGWQIHTGNLIANANGLAFEREVNKVKISFGIHDDVKFVPICQSADQTGKNSLLNSYRIKHK